MKMSFPFSLGETFEYFDLTQKPERKNAGRLHCVKGKKVYTHRDESLKVSNSKGNYFLNDGHKEN